MLEEIAEQPAALEITYQEEREKVKHLARYLQSKNINLIVLVARGSSDNAALYGRYLLEMTTGIPVSLAAPSVYTLYHANLRLSNALVIGISQSGEGEDINYVLQQAKISGALTAGITNESSSSMSKIVDVTFNLHGGKERSVAATRTFTGQMMILAMLAGSLAASSATGRESNAISHEDLLSLPAKVARVLELKAEIEALAQTYVFMENCVVVGRGLAYANAYELALKLMETCYVVAERFSTADFFHGPLALIERHFPVIAFALPGKTLSSIKPLLERLSELDADTMVITSDAETARLCRRRIKLPIEVNELLAPIPYMVPGQLFAAYLAKAKGLNPDQPRSLSKITRTL